MRENIFEECDKTMDVLAYTIKKVREHTKDRSSGIIRDLQDTYTTVRQERRDLFRNNN